MYSDIYSLVKSISESQPEAPAIMAPGKEALTYSALTKQMQEIMKALAQRGFAHNHRVCIVLPNGPELAAAFMGVACSTVSAPLNPGLQASEYEYYLSDLEAKGLVTLSGWETPARKAARDLGITVLEVVPKDNGPAGSFKLWGEPCGNSTGPILPSPENIALVLHTSGTTARPKMVPLTHKNLCESAGNIKRTLSLTPEDRCLNVMPLFHIHGLAASVLSSLASGAAVICSPGFFAPKFFDWIEKTKPTWYTAVPTIHQSILKRAKENQDIINANPLRFIRSSSSSLAPTVLANLEKTFQVPVIEAYGMTEAAHQMACNPLPPLTYKPGSVGPPAGPEMAIMAEEHEELLPPGNMGEIVIRGPNVMSEYVNRPEANEKAFSGGWFRTGDQGYVDPDGYFFISGRLKEIINRGGEKISPREVDELLLTHPSVIQAVTFGMPDNMLGEEVAAAVIVNDPAATESVLRRFAALHLAHFKVPKRVVVVDEIPKGPTGKLQRIGLAEKLGIISENEEASPTPFTPPRNSIEEILSSLWEEILCITHAGIHNNFLDQGGDSVLALQLVSRVREQFQVEISLVDFLDAPTIEMQAAVIEGLLIDEIENSPEP